MVCTLAFFAAALAVYFELTNERLLFVFCREDGLVESSEALLYFLSAIFFIVVKRSWKNPWRLLLGLLCIVIAGEEVSWGQRFFGFSTPEALGAINLQNEFNLHNIAGVNGVVLGVGLVVFSMLSLLVPLTNRFSESWRGFYKRVKIPIFPMPAAIVVVFAMFLMAVPRLFFGVSSFNLDEVGELYLASAMFMFSLRRMKS